MSVDNFDPPPNCHQFLTIVFYYFLALSVIFHLSFCRDSIIVPTVTGFTSVYSGFAIFTVLGFMAHQKGVDVSQVAAQGESTKSKGCNSKEV